MYHYIRLKIPCSLVTKWGLHNTLFFTDHMVITARQRALYSPRPDSLLFTLECAGHHALFLFQNLMLNSKTYFLE